jgi:hypothetical protein
MAVEQTELSNGTIRNYPFLKDMYEDAYFPDHLVDKGKRILLDLCSRIEQDQPKDLQDLYALTHAATDQFNQLQEEFEENESEIETGARECIGMDIKNIATAYGYDDADIEELIATRDW